MKEFELLYDDISETKTRFISFVGEYGRYDLCLLYSNRFYGKVIVLNMLSNKFVIIGEDDLFEESFLETSFQIDTNEAVELRIFLKELIK
ncbi:MAG: hypothetical protein K0R71_842 [Bacillales bacterium]|jgi:hypothetical protein|nr:hypothetical protein [Bacillales bacterium]